MYLIIWFYLQHSLNALAIDLLEEEFSMNKPRVTPFDKLVGLIVNKTSLNMYLSIIFKIVYVNFNKT